MWWPRPFPGQPGGEGATGRRAGQQLGSRCRGAGRPAPRTLGRKCRENPRVGPGTAASTTGAGTVGRSCTEEALPNGELPVGLATKALPTVALLHEVAAGDASASPEPDESAAMLAVDARRACEGGALRQDVGASTLAALHGETRCSAPVHGDRDQLGLVQVGVPGPPSGGPRHVDAANREKHLTASEALPGSRQVNASLGKDPAQDFSVPRIIPTWPSLEACHAGSDSHA